MPLTTSLPGRPVTGSGITPTWLTGVLHSSGALPAEQRVTSADVGQIAVGVGFVSDLYRVRPTYSAPGAGPASVIVKLPTDSPYRVAAEQVSAYVRELAFYREVAPAAPLRVPRAYLAEGATGAADPGEFALVMEDLGGLEAADHLAGLSLARAERVIDRLAEFHAWSTRATLPAAFPRIDDALSVGLFRLGPATGWAAYRALHKTPTHCAENPDSRGWDADGVVARLPDAVPGLAALLAEPSGLAHGDLRVDNLFFTPDDDPAVVDFQFAVRGSGVYDVAYLLSQGLRTEVRRGHDRRLVQRYGEAVGLDPETVWRQYQAATLLALSFPLVAVSGWDALGARARELCRVLVERALATIEDIGAAELLG